MTANQRKVAFGLFLAAGGLAGLAAVIQFWRSGRIELLLLVVAVVFVLIGLGVKRGKT